MCKGLLSERDEISGGTIWLALPHFWVAISMVFFGIGTVFTLKKLCGEPNSLDWWNLFIYFGIAECFVFLVCTKWCNPVIHSSIVGSTEDISENTMCGLQGAYGCFIKFLIICFQILLCMRLEGKPAAARFIPLPVIFSPVFLVQGLGVLFAAISLWEKIVILLHTRTDTVIYIGRVARPRDTFNSLQHGSRLGSRSTGSRGEQTRINCNESSRYNTFSTYPRETVKTFPKKEQAEITESSRQDDERLQNDENLCRICYDKEINTVLLPCRHRILCSICGEKCQKCPICRVMIGKRLAVDA
ncbi:uncharacterized protein LOC143539449 [Bidens hawaiensis]|uniref:uncharacterized protein LOC143539449 n=1 Tax=Bidens hawaiensis TaxID=980011 RepID=UPI00404B9BA7